MAFITLPGITGKVYVPEEKENCYACTVVFHIFSRFCDYFGSLHMAFTAHYSFRFRGRGQAKVAGGYLGHHDQLHHFYSFHIIS